MSRRPFLAIAWVVAVIVIALGAAGLVTTMDAGGERDAGAALTGPGDAEVDAALDAIESDIDDMAAGVDELGTQSRGALASLVGGDHEAVETAIATGDGIIAELGVQAAGVAAALDAVPRLDDPDAAYTVSGAVRERYEQLRGATGAVDTLPGAWTNLTTGAFAASRLSAALAAHDQAVLDAAALGRDAKYEDAIATLDGADEAIATARTLRNAIVERVDVAILDSWLDRNADYDAALRRLYAALDDVGGRVTDDVRDAIEGERAAKDRLPPDARGLVLIMSDIGRGWMNEAVIEIERVRGRLDEARRSPASPTPDAAPASPAPTTP